MALKTAKAWLGMYTSDLSTDLFQFIGPPRIIKSDHLQVSVCALIITRLTVHYVGVLYVGGVL